MVFSKICMELMMSSSCEGREGQVAAPRPPAGTCAFLSPNPREIKGAASSPPKPIGTSLWRGRGRGMRRRRWHRSPPRCPTCWHVSRNSSKVTTPSPFLSIFCKGRAQRGPSPSPLMACQGRGRAHLEEELHVLGGRAVPQGGQGAAPHHVVDGLHDLQHLLGRVQSGAG